MSETSLPNESRVRLGEKSAQMYSILCTSMYNTSIKIEWINNIFNI